MEKVGESLKLITGSSDGRMSVDAARIGAVILSVVSLVGASKYTRKRVDEGQAPILGVLF